MNTDYLQDFLVLAEIGNYEEAAFRLFVRDPANPNFDRRYVTTDQLSIVVSKKQPVFRNWCYFSPKAAKQFFHHLP